MEEQIADIVQEIEEENALRSSIVKMKFPLNQPDYMNISSANSTDTDSTSFFSSFTVNLPRPVLEAETVQLVNANIPQCVPNIPDTACGFWYYRLSEYSGKVPSLNNLYYVRLLPSYYKKEFITNPNVYGYNQTFSSYPEVAAQLALACSSDLAYTNYIQDLPSVSFYGSSFSPQDILISYDSAVNKFRMEGKYAFKVPAWELWNIGTAYAVGDQVVFDRTAGGAKEVSYICLVANTGNQPNLSPAFWLENNQPVISAWDITVIYDAGRYASYAGVLYVSKRTTVGDAPDISPLDWDIYPFDVGDVWNRYLITGYNDPNVAIAQKQYFQPYDQYTLFEANTTVEYEGQFYLSVRQTRGNAPPSADWILESISATTIVGTGTTITIDCDNSAGTIVGGDVVYVTQTSNNIFNSIDNPFITTVIQYIVATASATQITIASSLAGSSTGGIITRNLPYVYGMHEISQKFDMNLNQYFVPVGIPAQPFNPHPKRLLNSILGFAWNGQFTASTFANITANVVNLIPTTSTALFNRLRPVPTYIVGVGGIGIILGNAAATETQTYTAEGYANLVYSSIASIYTTIVGGSTLDTFQNTNLLATGTMNCGNLGISFFSPFINNPLEIYGGDIYSITIDLRDEFNEPYILTNNAVVSIALKMTYKENKGK